MTHVRGGGTTGSLEFSNEAGKNLEDLLESLVQVLYKSLAAYFLVLGVSLFLKSFGNPAMMLLISSAFLKFSYVFSVIAIFSTVQHIHVGCIVITFEIHFIDVINKFFKRF
ncbi:hypothetical protein ACJX0J_032695 [Zea mays]